MKEGYRIRRATFVDAEAIFALIRRHPEELLGRPVSDIVANIDRFLVCLAADEVVGTISWQVLPEIGAPRHPAVEIKSLAVDVSHRGLGVGHALIAQAIERIRELDPYQLIALTFRPDFFRKQGFMEIPKEKLMHKIYMGCSNCTKYDSPFTCPEIAMGLQLRDAD